MSDFLKDCQTIEAFAAGVGRHPRIIRRWTAMPDGMPFIKVNNLIIIHIPTAREWLFGQIRHPNPTRGAIEQRNPSLTA
jgi:hypothetical protein